MEENQIYRSLALLVLKLEEWGHQPMASISWKKQLGS